MPGESKVAQTKPAKPQSPGCTELTACDPSLPITVAGLQFQQPEIQPFLLSPKTEVLETG